MLKLFLSVFKDHQPNRKNKISLLKKEIGQLFVSIAKNLRHFLVFLDILFLTLTKLSFKMFAFL